MVGAGVVVLWLGYVVTYWGGTYIVGKPLGFTTVAWRKTSVGTKAKATASKAKTAKKG